MQEHRNLVRTLRAAALLLGACTGAGQDLVLDEGKLEDEAVSSALSGDNAAGQNLSGINLGGTNLGGSNLGGANLGGNNLGGTNLAGNNLGGTNLGGNNLGGNNLAGTNLGGSNLAGTNLAGTNLAGTNLAGSTLSGSTAVAGSYAAKGTPISGTYRLTSAAFTAGNAGVDIHTATARSAAAMSLLSSGEDTWGRVATEASKSSCVVMGVGSAGFSRLVEENRTSGLATANTMYAALRAQPWGFATTSGGARTLNSWEMVVWGARSYCVFVAVAPAAIDFPMMAGFVKAIFRWNAPAATKLYIGEIGTNRALVYYTGMMGAAQKLSSGAITEKVHLAGLMAFATATTNNISVKVDFASWVMGANGVPIVLGNVAGMPPYVEGSFMAFEPSLNKVGVVAIKSEEVDVTTWTGVAGVSGYTSFTTAYSAWKAGLRATKPVPKRCLWAKLNSANEPLPAGKCDSYLTLETNDLSGASYTWTPTYTPAYQRGGQSWSTFLANQGLPVNNPSNTMMEIPIGLTDASIRREVWGGSTRPISTQTFKVLSQTFIAVNELPYD